MSTPRLTTVPTTRRGRPRRTNSVAAELIGSAGVAALQANDVYIVTGDIVRELALVVGEAPPVKPQRIDVPESPPKPNEQAARLPAEGQ